MHLGEVLRDFLHILSLASNDETVEPIRGMHLFNCNTVGLLVHLGGGEGVGERGSRWEEWRVRDSTHLSQSLSKLFLWSSESDGAALRLRGGDLHPHAGGLQDLL